MRKLLISLVLTFSFSSFPALASEDHDHKDEAKPSSVEHQDHKDGDKHDEKEEEGHGDHADGEEHEEENPQVGPDKGIVEANKEKGFKLSAEAERNFGIQKIKVLKIQSLEIPKNAIVTAGMEVNLYRYRDGYYKRIDFKTIASNQSSATVTSKDLVLNDEVAVSGLGFLRISEISAFDGAPAGHSH